MKKDYLCCASRDEIMHRFGGFITAKSAIVNGNTIGIFEVFGW